MGAGIINARKYRKRFIESISMIILELDQVQLHEMGKNRKSQIKGMRRGINESEFSEEHTETKGCPHVNKAVNFSAMRKNLSKQKIGHCMGCGNKASEVQREPVQNNIESMNEESERLLLFVCLQCGYLGCNSSQNDHAMMHYNTAHSSSHFIFVNMQQRTVWCYKCDVEVGQHLKIAPCLEFLKKQIEPQNKPTTGKRVQIVQNACEPCVFKVKGLVNNGNTCYFNALMQNLIQTSGLESQLDEWIKAKTLEISGDIKQKISTGDGSILPPINIKLPEAGALTKSLLNFLHELSSCSHGMFKPNSLFTQIARIFPCFNNGQQHDSHELLISCLDRLKEEEIKRRKTGLLRYFSIDGHRISQQQSEQMKPILKAYLHQAQYTFVDQLFGGYMINSVICQECHMMSQRFEVFLQLSLTVEEMKSLIPNKNKESNSSNGTTEKFAIDCFAEKPLSKYAEKKLRKKAKAEARRKTKQMKSRAQRIPLVEYENSEEEITGIPDNKDEDLSDATVEDDAEAETCHPEKFTNDCGVNSSIYKQFEENSENSTFNSLETTQANILHQEEICDEMHFGPQTNSFTSTATLFLSAESMTSRVRCLGLSDTQDGNLPECRTSCRDKSICENNCVTLADTTTKVDETGDINKNKGCENCACTNGDESDRFFTWKLNQRKVAESSNIFETSAADHVKFLPVTGDFAVPIKNESQVTEYNEELSSKINVLEKEQDKSTETMEFTENVQFSIKTKNYNSEQQDSDSDHLPDLKAVSQEHVEYSCMNNEKSIDKELRHSESKSIEGKDFTEVWKSELHGDVTEAQRKSVIPLVPRTFTHSSKCTFLTCLYNFTSEELMMGKDKYHCENCSRKKEMKYKTVAIKQQLIFRPPTVLIVQLRRFVQAGHLLTKLNRHIDFPFVLDLAPFCSSVSQCIRQGQKQVLYHLYGIVEHRGSLNGGHYVAYVKLRDSKSKVKDFLQNVAVDPIDYMQHYKDFTHCSQEFKEKVDDIEPDYLVPSGKWYYISDTTINEVDESKVQKAQAFLLFYERIF